MIDKRVDGFHLMQMCVPKCVIFINFLLFFKSFDLSTVLMGNGYLSYEPWIPYSFSFDLKTHKNQRSQIH